jgi:hypothetical protein
MLAARSIRANNSPPKRLFNGFVSLGKTKSVNTVKDSEGCFEVIFFLFLNLKNFTAKAAKFYLLEINI